MRRLSVRRCHAEISDASSTLAPRSSRRVAATTRTRVRPIGDAQPSAPTSRCSARQPSGVGQRLADAGPSANASTVGPGARDDGGDAVGPQRVDQRERLAASPAAGSPGAGSRGSRASRCSGWPARAATSSAARPALAAASACGTVGGQQAAGDLGRDRRRRARTRPRDPRVDGATGRRRTRRRPPGPRSTKPAEEAPARRCRGGPRCSAASAKQRLVVEQQRAAGDQRRGPARPRRRSRPRTTRARGRAGSRWCR